GSSRPPTWRPCEPPGRPSTPRGASIRARSSPMSGPERSFALGGAVPRAVVRPETSEAVATTLREAAAAGQAVVPGGGGKTRGWGHDPGAYARALDLPALAGIREYEPAALVVPAQAGVPLATLQRGRGEAGQSLALDPPYAERATLGGTLATNASG